MDRVKKATSVVISSDAHENIRFKPYSWTVKASALR